MFPSAGHPPQVYKHTLLNGRKRTPEELKRLELIEAAKRKPKKRKGVHWAAEIEQAEPTQHHALTGSETRIGGSGLFGEVGRFALWSTESKTDPGVGQFQNLVSETRLERGVKNVGQVCSCGRKRWKVCSHVTQPWLVAIGGWRLVEIAGWRLVVGGWWRLAAVGGSWQLVMGGWRRLAAVDGWRLAAAGGWRLVAAFDWSA